ncbi:MAG: hypothetical protein DME96_11125 [Verrucomicrobia bacterium]|nr:MAG: hypothetical protein DME96_11125 [Verrucomicrobiota bacterium]
MRKSVANAVVPVGWPPLSEVLSKIVAKKTPIYACGACSRARGITEADLVEYGAKFRNPKIFVSLVEWTDKIITKKLSISFQVSRVNCDAPLLRSNLRSELACRAICDHGLARSRAARSLILRPENCTGRR